VDVQTDKGKLTLLYAPLNWGLGHASRGIYLIQTFLDAGHRVILAADGDAYFLLQSTFPDLELKRLPFYSVRYSGIFPIWLKMFFSLPGFFRSVRREHRLLKEIIREKKVDIIVSDNRYGLYHRKVYSIFITHQLFIRAPGPFRIFEPILFRWNRKRLKHFSEVWVPDFPGGDNLAGLLSHPLRKKIRKVRYIGPISRFMHPVFSGKEPVTVKYDVVVILSGPEPHRTVLERILIRKLRRTDYRVLMFRGILWKKEAKRIYDNIRLVTHLDSSLFYTYLTDARYVIARAGYTTIMDMVALQKPAILIPTPGQPEQEYLAAYLSPRNRFIFMHQDEIDLVQAFNKIDVLESIDMNVQPSLVFKAAEAAVQAIYQSRRAARKKPVKKPV